MKNGALYVMISGITEMQEWYAISLDMRVKVSGQQIYINSI